jgi:hypothetical protein
MAQSTGLSKVFSFFQIKCQKLRQQTDNWDYIQPKSFYKTEEVTG